MNYFQRVQSEVGGSEPATSRLQNHNTALISKMKIFPLLLFNVFSPFLFLPIISLHTFYLFYLLPFINTSLIHPLFPPFPSSSFAISTFLPLFLPFPLFLTDYLPPFHILFLNVSLSLPFYSRYSLFFPISSFLLVIPPFLPPFLPFLVLAPSLPDFLFPFSSLLSFSWLFLSFLLLFVVLFIFSKKSQPS